MTVNTLLELAGDRLRLGIGSGLPWKALVEQQIAAKPPLHAMREAVETMRTLLSGGCVSFGGETVSFRVNRKCFQDAPEPRSLAVPIYMGGSAEPVLKRAARIGDGYIGWENPRCTLRDLPGMISRLSSYRRHYGREHAPFEIKFLPRGKELADAERLRDLGITDLICTPWQAGPFAPDVSLGERLDALRRYADEVMARLR